MNNPVESEEKQEKKKENSNFQQEHEKSLGLISQLVRYAPTGGSLWILGSFIKEQDWLSTLITFPLMVIMVAWSAYSKSFLLKIQERMKERGKEDADSLMAQFQKLDSAIKEAIKWQLAGVEDKYLKSQGNACLYYTTEGSQSTFKPLLKDVFIPLELSGDFFRDSTGEDIPTPRGYQWDKQLIIESQKDGLTIWDIFKRLPKNSAYRNLAILAWGGYGKTTLLRHIAYTYAKKKLPRGVPKLLPVLLLLRKWQRVIAEEKPDLTVLIEEHHIPSLPEGKNFKRPKNWAKNLLSQNKFLIMFDGFDEVKEEWRESVSKWLGQMMHNYPGAYFILTSRPAGYKSYKPENKPNTLRLKAFNEEQRERFINKWYLSRERQISAEPDNPVVKQTAEQKSANLVKQLKERSELNDLAKNPLLLNMIVNLHSVAPTDTSDLSRPIQLPQRRTELYREIFRLQLGDRPLVKQINMCFDADEAQQILQDFALYMVKENKSNIDDKQLKGQVEKPIHKLDESIEADLFIKQIVEVSELLVKKDENYEFSHLSFQGYLAAKEIIRTKQETLLINNWDKSWWRETILLYGAQVNPSNLIPGVNFSLMRLGR
ncbi:MAG: NACHT domain-containing protein [Prochloraceae cyanobacterium]|nr:NACHT domain-containing protein [Prochloraceae cyanobacterium]